MDTKVTYCIRGHELTPGNTYVYPKKGKATCRICLKAIRNVGRFGGNREAVIERDGQKCVRCGMTRTEHRAKFGRDITIDHIDGNGSNMPQRFKNNAMDNLQTLCVSCHSKKDVVRVKHQAMGSRHGLSKLIEEDIKDIRAFHAASISNVSIAKMYHVHEMTISKICRRMTWKHVVEVTKMPKQTNPLTEGGKS